MPGGVLVEQGDQLAACEVDDLLADVVQRLDLPVRPADRTAGFDGVRSRRGVQPAKAGKDLRDRSGMEAGAQKLGQRLAVAADDRRAERPAPGWHGTAASSLSAPTPGTRTCRGCTKTIPRASARPVQFSIPSFSNADARIGVQVGSRILCDTVTTGKCFTGLICGSSSRLIAKRAPYATKNHANPIDALSSSARRPWPAAEAEPLVHLVEHAVGRLQHLAEQVHHPVEQVGQEGRRQSRPEDAQPLQGRVLEPPAEARVEQQVGREEHRRDARRPRTGRAVRLGSSSQAIAVTASGLAM